MSKAGETTTASAVSSPLVAWRVPLCAAEMGERERTLLVEAFDTGWHSASGPMIGEFEKALAELCGVPEAVAVSSGTAGLHLALLAAGVGPGDDVLVSTMTFAATGFAVSYTGAVPHFVDCDSTTWQMDVSLVEEELRRRARLGSLPKAVVSVDIFGSMADQIALESLCDEYGVTLIEDAAEAIGSSIAGRMAGSFGRFGVLSFNGNKLVTTGGGGAVLAASSKDRDAIRKLSVQGRSSRNSFDHDLVGYNYRLGNLAAGIGLAQLESLAVRVDQRTYVRFLYEEQLQDIVTFQEDLPLSTSNRWLTTVLLPPGVAAEVMGQLRETGVEARPGFVPLHMLGAYSGASLIGPRNADRLARRMLSLPSSGRLSEKDISEICAVIRRAVIAVDSGSDLAEPRAAS